MTYTSTQSHEDMLNVINHTITDNVNEDIQSSDFVGIIVGETTELTVQKQTGHLFQVFKCKPVIRFVGCVCEVNGKADTTLSKTE